MKWPSAWPELRALTEQEFILILRNKHLLFLLLFPTTLQLVILGFALNPGLNHENVIVFDESNTSMSRCLTDSLSNTNMFSTVNVCPGSHSPRQLFGSDAGKVLLEIPHSLPQDLERTHKANVQVVLDGTDAYTASLSRGYLTAAVLETTLKGSKPQTVQPNIHVVYNPGLVSPWYFVPGLLGALLTLSATLVSSAVMLRERENGTLEHLLMLPVTSAQMFTAKVLPIFSLLFIDLLIALSVSKIVFDLPMRGALWLFLLVSSIFIVVVIGIGVFLGTVCKNQKQAKLLSFFVNIPLFLFSGIVVPINTMPEAFKLLSAIDPLHYFQACSVGILLKGAGLSEILPNVICLIVSASIVVLASIWRFRSQPI